MSHLPEEHLDALKYVRLGGFSVQLSNSNSFGRVPVDQTCKETVNKDTETSGGTKGFSLKPNAVSKYYLVAEYRSTFLRQLRGKLQINSSSPKHNDLHSSRITRDENDVKNIISLLQDTRIPSTPTFIKAGLSWTEVYQNLRELVTAYKKSE